MSIDIVVLVGKIQLCLKQKYNIEIKKVMQEEFGYVNVMQIFGLVKVVVNIGVGEVVCDSKVIDGVVDDFIKIIGQKLIVMKVCKFIVQFKLCEGQVIGVYVIFCGDCVWEFVDCFVLFVLFCICDFCGFLVKQFDGNGNYIFGFQEQSVFYEIDQDKIDWVCGFDIIVVIIVKMDDEGWVLFCYFGFLFCLEDVQV